jgi:hypothetical protein
MKVLLESVMKVLYWKFASWDVTPFSSAYFGLDIGLALSQP